MFGVNQSKEIVRNENFNSIEKIMESDEEALKQIGGIGDIVASNIYNFFRKEKNRDIILKLKEHGIRMEVQEEKENLEDIEIVSDIFKDKIFVLTGNFSKPKKEIEKEAKELLEIVGLAERMKHKPNQLSGGEKQRVAIARAMINKPKLILADEPTGNLDEDTGELIFSLFRKINKEHNQSIVVVTHARDLSQVTDRQVYLKRGVLE